MLWQRTLQSASFIIAVSDFERIASPNLASDVPRTVEDPYATSPEFSGSSRRLSPFHALLPQARPRAVPEDRRGRLVCRSFLQAVADVSDRHLIARLEPPIRHTPAVDPGPVGAAQVPHDDFTGILCQDAVTERDPVRAEPGIALR